MFIGSTRWQVFLAMDGIVASGLDAFIVLMWRQRGS
jgi:hypothetical protein